MQLFKGDTVFYPHRVRHELLPAHNAFKIVYRRDGLYEGQSVERLIHNYIHCLKEKETDDERFTSGSAGVLM